MGNSAGHPPPPLDKNDYKRAKKAKGKERKAKLKKLDKSKYTAELKVDDTYVNVDFADFAQID